MRRDIREIVGTSKKPKMSYKKLIFSALVDSPERRLKLTEIYDWILERYPAFRANKNGFQNSIRHNLSLNKMSDCLFNFKFNVDL